MQKNIEIVGNIKMSIWTNGSHREQSYVMSVGGVWSTLNATYAQHERKLMVCRKVLKQ